MQIGIVKGQIVSTKKTERLQGIKILVVQPFEIETFREAGAPFASLDNIGAGEGDVVMTVGGSSARQTDIMSDKPTDSTIVAILDSVDILGQRVFEKSTYDKKRLEAKPIVKAPQPESEPSDGADASAALTEIKNELPGNEVEAEPMAETEVKKPVPQKTQGNEKTRKSRKK